MIFLKMLDITLILIILLAVLVVYSFKEANKRPKHYPSGPFQLPVVGYIPFINRKSPILTFERLAKTYGDAFSIKQGVHNIVYLNSWNLAKEALSHADIQERPEFSSFNLAGYGKRRGIVPAQVPIWHEHRRFALRHLRDFGFGKTSFEDVILTEVDTIKQCFSEERGEPFEVAHYLNVSVLNLIWKMVADFRFDKTDPFFLQLTRTAERFAETITTAVVLDFFPWLSRYLPDKMTGVYHIVQFRDLLYKVSYKFLQEHKDTFDESNLRDLLDVYIQKQKEDERNNIDNSTFTDLQIGAVLFDMFVAGSETTSTSLRYVFICLMNYPDIQKKLQEDIYKVTKGERSVSLNDQNELPYVEAFIMETQRLCSIVPLGVPHRTSTTVRVGDYVLPKDTVVIAHSRYIHHDPAQWPDPEKFDPTRFLSETGTVNRKISGYLPFSVGKRQCLGENLAKAELFLFLTNLLQEFTFTPAPGHPAPSPTEATFGLVIHPPVYKMVATPRKRQ